jgi:hypothetical protein
MLRQGVVLAAVLLTGCTGPGDRAVPRMPALVVIKNNAVCVISSLTPDEKITSIQFYSHSGDKLIKMFHKQPVYTARGECLPVFNFTFVPGKHYALAWDVETSDPENYHLITAEFSVAEKDNGELKLGSPGLPGD